MAIVKDNILLQLVRGTIGRQVTIYERNGQIIMAKKRRPSNRKPTQKQLEARHKMRVAADLARDMMNDPVIKAYYASLAGPGQNAYNMAVKDAYRSPEVQNIRLEGTDVIVTANDEFRVASVSIQIIDTDGVIIEGSPAVLSRNGIDWHYKAAKLPAGGNIIVTVTDLPGNKTVKELVIIKKE